MPSLQLLLLVFFLGCATGALFMALLRRRAIDRVRREFEEELHTQLRSTDFSRQWPPDSRSRKYDA